jgi:ATP-dependent helicase/DNAse subunit B
MTPSGSFIYYININYTHRYNPCREATLSSLPMLSVHHDILNPMTIKLEEYTLPEHISYSAFSTYLTCGYQYYLGRLLQKQEEPSVWSVGGSAFHLACETYDRDNL